MELSAHKRAMVEMLIDGEKPSVIAKVIGISGSAYLSRYKQLLKDIGMPSWTTRQEFKEHGNLVKETIAMNDEFYRLQCVHEKAVHDKLKFLWNKY